MPNAESSPSHSRRTTDGALISSSEERGSARVHNESMNSSRNTLAVFAATGFDIGGGESSELKLSMTGSIVNEPGSGRE